MADPIIEIMGFTKRYGQFTAVNDLTMTVEHGDIFGLIGPNGAGKTTTFRFLATLLDPTRGTAFVNGYNVVKQIREVRRSIGYMPDNYGVYDGMRVWEFLDFFAVAYGLRKDRRPAVVEDLMALLDLTGKRDSLVNSLSRGMRQRLCLAKTLVHDPPVLILDEPASGLDPRARIEIKEFLKELRRMGKTILISSHILSELADCCNKVAIIERGQLLIADDIRAVMARIHEGNWFEVRVLGDRAQAKDMLMQFPDVIKVQPTDSSLRVDYRGAEGSEAEMLKFLIDHDVQVTSFREVKVNLEDAFMKITRGDVA